jgi:hypothetical protein
MMFFLLVLSWYGVEEPKMKPAGTDFREHAGRVPSGFWSDYNKYFSFCKYFCNIFDHILTTILRPTRQGAPIVPFRLKIQPRLRAEKRTGELPEAVFVCPAGQNT